jgi:hypothetical protein
MLIKDDKRIITDDGNQTYRAFGFVLNLHNRLFSGSIIIKFKYGYRDIDRKVDSKLKQGVSFVKARGVDLKYLEVRFVSIPKGKK